jgi:hypothetical protein
MIQKITSIMILVFPISIILIGIICAIELLINGNGPMSIWIQIWAIIAFYSGFIGGGIKGILLFIENLK